MAAAQQPERDWHQTGMHQPALLLPLLPLPLLPLLQCCQ
jgi:hypothetical protein